MIMGFDIVLLEKLEQIFMGMMIEFRLDHLFIYTNLVAHFVELQIEVFEIAAINGTVSLTNQVGRDFRFLRGYLNIVTG